MYVALDGADFMLNILPSTVNAVRDGQGNILSMKKMPPVNVVFNGGKTVIDEFFAKGVAHKLQAEITPEIIAGWVEAQSGFGKSFICVQSPDKSMTAEELKRLKDAENAKKNTGPKIVTGARGTRH